MKRGGQGAVKSKFLGLATTDGSNRFNERLAARLAAFFEDGVVQIGGKLARE